MMVRLMTCVPLVSPASAVRCCRRPCEIRNANMCQLQAIAFLNGRSLSSLTSVLHAKFSRPVTSCTMAASSGVSRSHTKASTQRKHRSAGREGQQASAVQPHPPAAPNCIDDAAEVLGGTSAAHTDCSLLPDDVLGPCLYACM